MSIRSRRKGPRWTTTKTVNNVSTVPNVLFKKAVEWDVIDRLPCAIRLLPIPRRSAGFYDFEDYERLVAALKRDHNAYLVVLLGRRGGFAVRRNHGARMA